MLKVSGFVILQFHEENSIAHESKFGIIYPLINMRRNSLSSSIVKPAWIEHPYVQFKVFKVRRCSF